MQANRYTNKEDWVVRLWLSGGGDSIFYGGFVPFGCDCRQLRVVTSDPFFNVRRGPTTTVSTGDAGNFTDSWTTFLEVNGVVVDEISSSIAHTTVRDGFPGTFITTAAVITNYVASGPTVISYPGYDPAHPNSYYLQNGVVTQTLAIPSGLLTHFSDTSTVARIPEEEYLEAAGAESRTRALLSDGEELASAPYSDEGGLKTNRAYPSSLTAWSGGEFADLFDDINFTGNPIYDGYPFSISTPAPTRSTRLVFDVPVDVCKTVTEFGFSSKWRISGGSITGSNPNLSYNNANVYLIRGADNFAQLIYSAVNATYRLNHDGSGPAVPENTLAFANRYLQINGAMVGLPPEPEWGAYAMVTAGYPQIPQSTTVTGGVQNSTKVPPPPGTYSGGIRFRDPSGTVSTLVEGSVKYELDASGVATYTLTNCPTPLGRYYGVMGTTSTVALLSGTVVVSADGLTVQRSVTATNPMATLFGFAAEWEAGLIQSINREVTRFKKCYENHVNELRTGVIPDSLSDAIPFIRGSLSGSVSYVTQPFITRTTTSSVVETVLESVVISSVTYNTKVRRERTRTTYMRYTDTDGALQEFNIIGTEVEIRTLYKSPTAPAYSPTTFFSVFTYTDWCAASTNGSDSNFVSFDFALETIGMMNGSREVGATNVFFQFDQNGQPWSPPIPITSDNVVMTLPSLFMQYRDEYDVIISPDNLMPPGAIEVNYRIADGEIIDYIPLSVHHPDKGHLGSASSSGFSLARDTHVEVAEQVGGLGMTFLIDWMFSYEYSYLTGLFTLIKAKRAPTPIHMKYIPDWPYNAIFRARNIKHPHLKAKAKAQRQRMTPNFSGTTYAEDSLYAAAKTALPRFQNDDLTVDFTVP